MKTYCLRHLWLLLAACLLFQNSMAAVSAVQMMEMDPMLHHAQMRGEAVPDMDHSNDHQSAKHQANVEQTDVAQAEAASNASNDTADCCDCECQYDCMLGVHSAFTVDGPALCLVHHQAAPRFIHHLWHSVDPGQQLKPPILH